LIGNDSKKIQVIVSQEDAQKIEKLAKEENRSVSNWVYNLIKQNLRSRKK